MDDLIGRSEGYFYLGSSKYVREDIQLKNHRGLDLQCSLFRAYDKERDKDKDSKARAATGASASGSAAPSPSPPPSPPLVGRTQMPCVVYCHCNSGSRRDAEEALLTLLPGEYRAKVGVWGSGYVYWGWLGALVLWRVRVALERNEMKMESNFSVSSYKFCVRCPNHRLPSHTL